jgi:two-component system CheB/CheR fusion protein
MAFVVIQHLSPDHESMLSEILARATSMPVKQAHHGLQVEADHVYVIPPNRDIRLEQGALKLGRRARGLQRHLPVDHFFRSLAQDCGTTAIGIVLSGSSSDGMQGLLAIKSAGGITFAQDEKTAKHPEMPRSAVASGAVDLALAPAEIARELGRLKGHMFVLQPESERLPEGEVAEADSILAILRDATGADFSRYKQSTIRRRVLRRMALARIERVEDYVALLRKRREEVEALYNDVLINVTSFFRDADTFKVFERKVLPQVLKKRDKESRIRIWVPGCSTGEEVYSLAICLFDHLRDGVDTTQVQVFGTDLSEAVVERARQGRYPPTIAADVPPERLQKYFDRTADGYQVRKTLRDACIFAKHNLLKDPPFSRIDVVSCRNVLIYFESTLQKKAFTLFHYALRPGGYLMLGSAEHVTRFHELFSIADRKHKIYVKKPVPSRLYFGEGPKHDGPSVRPARVLLKGETGARTLDVQKEADRIVMARYVPAGVVVDEDMDILQFRGHTGAFLESRPGAASLNLMKMAREGLLFELRAAFQRARKERAAIRRTGVRMKSDGGGVVEVALEVVPFSPRHSRTRLYLVTFELTRPPAWDRRAGDGRPATKPTRARTTQQELAATKEYLQTIIEEQEATNEELTSANEEILSSNEELQSTNEELETTKEELQSSNEELSTVNDELQDRNAQLNAINSDLTNLLATIHVPMVILDTELRVRRATPLGERMLNLVPADVGRRVTDIRPNVEIPDFPGIVRDVIENVTTRDLEVRDGEGHWYSMRVRPYTSSTRKIEGVVVTWMDSENARLRAQNAVRDLTQVVLGALSAAAALLGTDLRIVTANAAWAVRFGVGPQDGPHAWLDPADLEALRDVLERGRPLVQRVVQATTRTGATTPVTVDATRVSSNGQDPFLLLVCHPEAGSRRP